MSAPLPSPPPARSHILSPFQPCQAPVSLPEHARENVHVYGLLSGANFSWGISIHSGVRDKVMQLLGAVAPATGMGSSPLCLARRAQQVTAHLSFM